MFVPSSRLTSQWFQRYSGRAAAVLSVAVGLETLYPVLAQTLIAATGWRVAFSLMALVAGAVLCFAALILRDSPEQEGLCDDDGRQPVPNEPLRGSTLGQALCFHAFWLCLAASAVSAAFWTGLNLNIVTVFHERGLPHSV